MLQHLVVQRQVRHELLEPPVFILKELQTFRLIRLHPAVLVPPAVVRRFAHLQRLQHRRQILPGRQHRVRISQLPHDLLRTMPLPSLPRHRESPLPIGAVQTLITSGSTFGEQAKDGSDF